MTSEEKDLLLRDICGRLPYEVILVAPNCKTTYQTDGNTGAELLVEEGFKPYLRPMSSMTEEEKEELDKVTVINCNEFEGCSTLFDEEGFDWLNAHHFDYRGLIEKGLALEAPEGIYNINK